ncbi:MULTISPECIES: sigma-54 interaction domain-containing protein [unclassified Sedimentibacter]|uniref:sigma-54 interaction domain-containing protein n=1 Tax=unclassified Sedimentibacter TaxID=2649220 RepID=UPI0027E20C29|nr:sigma 54-interacting transcriptional regulator [Sedimentibacter sp. MB35-C1]WMJ77421.1 sigma 54-interacting transcriptional regulator [Sedimentibacter sp. MB35-C1]
MDYKNILKLVSENLYCGIFIVDKNGKVIFYNQSIHDLAGLKVENAIGKHLLEIFPRLTEETSTIMRTLKTGESLKNYVQNYYNYQDRKVTIFSSTIPLHENGQLEGVIEIFSDVEKYNNLNKSKKRNKVNGKAVYTLDNIIGSSSLKVDLKNKIKKTANSNSPVLVYGETGTGKELVVQSLHNESNRRGKPFIAQNCAAIPSTLFESILFGTKLGSFTGAQNSMGLIEAADGGTLFLDEINSMDITLQAKLLRFLQENQIRRIGDNTAHDVDVRIITALNENPYEAIKSGKLRSDLFYRLNAINFYVAPLRECKSDIVELSNYFLHHFSQKLNKNIAGFSDEVLLFFQNYSWPGNVRELRHSIEHAINITEGNIITMNDMPDYVIINQQKDIIKCCNSDIPLASPAYTGPLYEQVEKFERNVIVNALKQYGCNISKTSKKLGVPRQTLYYKMDKLKIRMDKTPE